MEKRQNAKDAVMFGKAEHLFQLRDVRANVVMAQQDAFGITRAAAGKDDGGE